LALIRRLSVDMAVDVTAWFIWPSPRENLSQIACGSGKKSNGKAL